MTVLTVAGRQIQVPEFSLRKLKKIFPIVRDMRLHTSDELADNPEVAMESIDQVIEILVVALDGTPDALTADQLEDQLTVSELSGLQATLIGILQDNGLTAKPGEPVPVGDAAEKSSTGTSTL